MSGMARLLVALSLACGFLYPLISTFPLPAATTIAAKGAGVALLALAAALQARTADGWLLTGLLALGAAGDVLIETDLGAGAAAFAAAHVASILLYLRNRQPAIGVRHWALAALLPIFAAILAFVLLRGRPEAAAFAVYSLLLGTMVAAAWLSRFPKGLVGVGASLFLASDMLIAAQMGSHEPSIDLGAAIWLLYYAGQALIFVGVKSSLPAQPVGRGTTRGVVEG
jgi:uncharacterized membrane protein YhhN